MDIKIDSSKAEEFLKILCIANSEGEFTDSGLWHYLVRECAEVIVKRKEGPSANRPGVL
jgi:hypothetical protein